MHAPSPSRRRSPRGVAELYSAVVLVAITLAVSAAVYAMVTFPVAPTPTYSALSFSAYGNPSVLHIEVNASSAAKLTEFRLDSASSLSGVLSLSASGYSVVSGLCGSDITTFFSVRTEAGELSILGAGSASVDGTPGSSAEVAAGWHEIIATGGSGCTVVLPGGTPLRGPSQNLSTIPAISSGQRSFLFLVPYYTAGHVVTIVFAEGSDVVEF